MHVDPLGLPPAVVVERSRRDARLRTPGRGAQALGAVVRGGVTGTVAEAVRILPGGDARPVVVEDVVIDVDLVRPRRDSWVTTRLAEIHRGNGEVVAAIGELLARDPGVLAEGVPAHHEIVADLVDEGLSRVALDQVVLDQEVVVVRIRPQAWAMVVMNPVGPDIGPIDRPELHPSGAATTWNSLLPVVGVVAHDLVVLDNQSHDRVTILVGVHPVLAVVAQATVPDLLPGTRHETRPRLFWIVLSSITQPSPESWFTTPWSCGATKPWMVRFRIVTFLACWVKANRFFPRPSRMAPGAPR